MSKILEGKVAIVTGSGQGIGRAIAMGFGAAGAKVITNNRKPGATEANMMTDDIYNKLPEDKKVWYQEQKKMHTGDAETTAQAIRDAGGEAAAFFGDFSQWDTARELVEFAVKTYGTIDIVCNVAGNFGMEDIDKMSEEMWDSVTATKPKGYFNVMRFAIPYMKKQGYGRIINCASPAWTGDDIKHAEYCAANAGTVGLSYAAAKELREYGITVNTFCPFARTRADYEAKALGMVAEAENRKLSASGRFAILDMDTPGPEHVAPFVTYLASEQSAKVSGAVFIVGGNMVGLYTHPTPEKRIVKEGSEVWDVDEVIAEAERVLFPGYVSIAEPRQPMFTKKIGDK